MIRVLVLLLLTGPAAAGWDAFQVIVWQDQTPARLAGLRALGVSAFRVPASRDDPAAIPSQAATAAAVGLPYYVENIATDWYSAYHRWRPGLPVDAAFREVRRLHAADPHSRDAFRRAPSLSDPAWRDRVAARLAAHVRAHPHALFFDLADEPGIANLAAPWDFDLTPASLDGFRTWLRGQYPDLAALNAEWGSGFATWDAVVPELTTEAMRRTDDDFAAWSDFKAWMDVAFARALHAGAGAVHAADPAALAGLEGGQIPGWGGWDYARLAGAVDVMEVYEAGQNLDILRSLAPDGIRLVTATGGPASDRAVWHAVMLGARGIIVWDPDGALVDDSGHPTEAGRPASVLWRELRGPLGVRLLAARPHWDPVAVLYSPASFRVQWMLDHRAAGDGWSAIGSEASNADDPVRAAMRQAAETLSHLGVQPRWIGPDDPLPPSVRAVVLPHVLALDEAMRSRLAAFVARGGTVFADIAPGAFDGHGRRRPASPLPTERLQPAALRRALGADWPDPWLEADATEMRVLDAPGERIVALLRDRGSGVATLRLREPAHATDLRHDRDLGTADRFEVPVEAGAPTIIAFQPRSSRAASGAK